MFNSNNDVIDFINNNLILIKDFNQQKPFEAGLYFFMIVLVLTSLSMPVALVLGLTAGIIFEPIKAVVLISFATSIGALFAFLLSRYIFRDYLKNKYCDQYEIINNGFVENGAFYLFALRMTPIFPYFMINVLTGLTTIKVFSYYVVTQIGMLPVSIIIILLGRSLDKLIISDSNTIDVEFIALLTLFGLMPLFFKYIFRRLIKS
tara:strand:+ start:1304 stop:1918 length:615 start_codon:yes stop_codon:yes gene_type:complete